jgi:lipopolysaccharide transport system permease protein
MLDKSAPVVISSSPEKNTVGSGKPPEGEALPLVTIEATRGLASLKLRAIWEYRELLYFLVWRDVKVRYKQTALGVSWIVLQPVVTIVVFSILFGQLLNVPSGGVPYPIFAYTALLPWNYFAQSLNKASTSLVGNAQLLTRIYFPRLIIPISGVLSGLLDFGIAFLILIGLMIFYRIAATPAVVLLPAFLLLAVVTAFAIETLTTLSLLWYKCGCI